jgi:hypothetical protein
MRVHNATVVGLTFQGCGYDGDDWWWLTTSFQFAEGSMLPVAVAATADGAAHAQAFVERCTDGDPSDCRRSWFDPMLATLDVTGSLDEYNLDDRRVRTHYTIHQSSADGIEDRLSVTADLTWNPPAGAQ